MAEQEEDQNRNKKGRPRQQDPLRVSNSFSGKMVKDYQDVYASPGMWIHARNAVNNAHDGKLGGLGNEQGNTYLGQAPHTVTGLIHHSGTSWVCFSTDDGENSGIGLFDEQAGVYRPLVTSACLGFRTTHLISGVCRENADKTVSVYFQDNLNPDRVLNLDNIPYRETGGNLSPDPDCFVPETDATLLDCDKLLLHPLVQTPEVRVRRGDGAGQLPNGSYQAVVAYAVDGLRVTDYFTPSSPQALWGPNGVGGSLLVEIDSLDERYDEYELAIISSINQQTVVRRIGYYSTRQKRVLLSTYNQSLPAVELAAIPRQSVIYQKSAGMFEVNGYLIRTGPTARKEVNYQPLANRIKSRWVAVAYPADYYAQGGSRVGTMRGEVYSYFIRWVYNSGHKTASYHIPGRGAAPSDTVTAGGNDAVDGFAPAWKVQDTSTYETVSGHTTPDGGRVVARGEMAYWESTEKYDDRNPAVWGDLCGKPIRHHKMPSNNTVHIHSQGGEEILVLGAEFYDIAHPLDEFGDPVADIVGYEILRGSREGNRSILAKGLFNNLVQYDIDGLPGKKGLYQNYPYNDLRPDRFLSSKLLPGRANPDDESNAITDFRQDAFSFHSPETMFNRTYLTGGTVELYTEQHGEVKGRYEFPHQHPRHKLITNFAFGVSAAVGVGIALVAALGKGKQTQRTTGSAVVVKGEVGVERESGTATIVADMMANLTPGTGNAFSTGMGVANLVFTAAWYVGMGLDQALETVRQMIPYQQYALQYNSHGFYNNFKHVPAGNRRRRVRQGAARYIGNTVQDLDGDRRVNNFKRSRFVAVETTGSFDKPTIQDTTRVRLQDKAMWKDPQREITSTTSAYYGALRVDYENQYGQLDAIVQVPTGNRVYPTMPEKSRRNATGPVFGGDVYITRYTEKNPYFFFNTWLQDVPDGTEIDYRHAMNGPFPRYWANLEKFDSGDLSIGWNNGWWRKGESPIELGTPSDMHHLDRDGRKSGNWFSIRNAYFYLFCNGVRDFFVESELNLGYRQAGDQDHEKHFDPYGGFAGLSTLFRADLIDRGNYFKYDLSLSASKIYDQFVSWGRLLPRSFDPARAAAYLTEHPNRAIYSLPQQAGLRRDNWLTWLPGNYKDFSDEIVSIKSMNASGAVILFKDGEPVSFTGVDQLKTEGGVKVTIGDGGLFQQGFQALTNADDSMAHGSAQSSRSAVNTPHGMFWISQKTGKIFHYSGSGADDITRLGNKYWFSEFLPCRLLQQFPEYPLQDNPVAGVGCQTVYDAQYELVYFMKKDYIALQPQALELDPVTGRFYQAGTEVRLTDPAHFREVSWTVSFDPKQQGFVSFHDWHPTLTVPSFSHFLSLKGKSFWRHNERTDLYCNYYGEDHPFEIEFPAIVGDTAVLRSVEFMLEAYRYYNGGRDALHLLEESFDRAVISNTEQVSGLLELVLKPKNNPVALLQFPQILADRVRVLYSKEENRFRFNQFWDVTRNRGEFDPSTATIWLTGENGYERTLNPDYVDYQKPQTQRKKFRHYGNRVWLSRQVSGDVKLVFIMHTVKINPSSR